MRGRHDYAAEPYEKMAQDNLELKCTVELTIRLHANGSLSVTGPTADKQLCYALLDNARDALKRHGSRELIVPATDTGIQV